MAEKIAPCEGRRFAVGFHHNLLPSLVDRDADRRRGALYHPAKISLQLRDDDRAAFVEKHV
jgi:hypothetical protein